MLIPTTFMIGDNLPTHVPLMLAILSYAMIDSIVMIFLELGLIFLEPD